MTPAPTRADVLAAVDALGPPGTPVTTPEVAEGFDCTKRTIYNRLETLVEDGPIETKKVGANSRVWWRPSDGVAERGGRFPPVDDAADDHPVFDSAVIGVVVWGSDARISDANDAFLEMTGLEYEEAVGTSWRELVPEEFHDVSEQRIDAAGENAPYEKQYYHADGSRRWGLAESRRMNGKTVEFVVDVTERKERERDLRESQKRLEAFVTSTSEVVYRMSPDWSEMYYLDGQEFVVDTDEPRETWIEEYIPADERPRIKDAVDDAIETESTFELEHQVMQADETRGWVHARAVPIRVDGEITEWFGTSTDISERKEAERKLRESEEKFRAVANLVPDLLWQTDADGSTVWYNRQWYDYTGQDPGAAAGYGWLDAVHPDDCEATRRKAEEGVESGTPFGMEYRLRRHDGEYRWFLVRVRPVEADDGDVRRWVGAATDIHDQRETTATLERLHDASLALLDAETGGIADRVAPLVRTVLDVEYAALWQYDERSGSLKEHAADVAADVDAEAVECPTGLADLIWETFVGTDVAVESDSDAASPFRSYVLVPLGRHGVVCLGSTHTGAFDERTVDLVKTVAATVETAWERAESERELERRNEELTRLHRLNALIRSVDEGLVEADTVDGIDEAVCRRLADSALYEFAWIGDFDANAGAVRPRSRAGVDATALEALAPTDGAGTEQDPFTSAIRTRETQVVADVATDPRAAPWRETALERGARSCLAIPLVYDESVYGVLVVYGTAPQRDRRSTEVLAEFGDTIAHAINAVETRETLRTDSVAELTLRTTGANTPLCRLARRLECSIEFEGLVPGSEEATMFFTVSGASAAAVLDGGEAAELDDLTCLVEEEDACLFRARVSVPTLPSLFLEESAVVQSLTVDDDVATAVVDVFRSDRIGSFLGRVEQSAPGLELLARRTRSRSLETRQTFRRTFEDRLTPRQQEVLHTAYRSGFFQSPRVQTATELAGLLDIAPATFTYHLREAERKLCEALFDAT